MFDAKRWKEIQHQIRSSAGKSSKEVTPELLVIQHKSNLVYCGEDRNSLVSSFQIERVQRIVELMNKRIMKLAEAYQSLV